MSNFIISPNMGLPVPTPGVDPGPDYAINEQTSYNTIDQHNHSPGKGVQINPNGLNINSDLPINGNNLTIVKTVNFSSQVSSLPGSSPNLGCVYVAGNELYYNDEAGNVVPITNNGSVNAGAGSITGLPSGTASASYSAGPGTFIWQSATNTAANMDGASFTFRQQIANANGITVSSPNSLGANYQMFWPTGLPPSIKFLTLDASGNMGDVLYVDNTTIEVAANNISLKDGGITDVKINASADIEGSKMLDGSISVAKLFSPMPTGSTVAVDGFAKGAVQTSANTTSNVYVPVCPSVTITTSGRPVFVGLRGSQTTQEGRLNVNGNTMFYRLFNTTSGYDVNCGIDVGGSTIFPSSVWGIDDSIIGVPGTYTYEFQVHCLASATIGVEFIQLVAYEI